MNIQLYKQQNVSTLYCYIPFTHALHCAFEELTWFTKVSSLKMLLNAVNACANRMWQLGFRAGASKLFRPQAMLKTFRPFGPLYIQTAS
jgi:hypothetical protein